MFIQWWDILLRLGLAIAVGFAVGLEREKHHRPAGIKTHIMVCMGAAIVSLIQLHMAQDAIRVVDAYPEMAAAIKVDFGRLGAQVISGIGFLGAGTILQRKGSIKGLTTAATLWLVACVGLAVGMGYYWIVGISLVLVMLVLIGLRLVQKGVFLHSLTFIEIRFVDKKKSMENIQTYLEENHIIVRNIEFADEAENDGGAKGKRIWQCCYTVVLPRTLDIQTLQTALLREEGILRVAETTE